MTRLEPDGNKRLVQQRFGRYADGYISSPTFASAPEMETFLNLAAPQPGWDVLDIATGGGHTALAFLPLVRRVYASDLTAAMLTSARDHARKAAGERFSSLAFHQVDAEALSYKSASFHLVTCRIAPHHFSNVPVFLKECVRVLRKGGVLVLQDHLLPDERAACEYINQFERLRDPSHQRGFSRPEWFDMFEQAGLLVLGFEKILKKHAFLPFAERQGCSPEVIDELARMLREAPEAVRQWRDPQGFAGDLGDAFFFDWHLLLSGMKK